MSDIEDFINEIAPFIEEQNQAENKLREAEAHNSEVDSIRSIGERILDHCLNATSTKRELIVQEGALRAEILIFLINTGIAYYSKDKQGKVFRHSASHIEEIDDLLTTSNPDAIPDAIFDFDGKKRLELKTVAVCTSKSSVPDSFFSKDLQHLTGNDPDKYGSDGIAAEYRNAELALIVGDRKAILSNKRLRTLLGDGFCENDFVKQHNAFYGYDGICYIVKAKEYKNPLTVKRASKNTKLDELLGILAFPARKLN